MISSPLADRTNARLADLGAIALFLLLSFWFTLPLLNDLTISCRGDWDYFSHLYQAASVSLFEYRQLPLWNPYSGGGIPLAANGVLTSSATTSRLREATSWW